MPLISPFVGLLFDSSRVGSLDLVTAPPYDVISRAEHERFLAASPYNVIRLDLGDVVDAGAAAGTDEDRYHRAAADLAAWREDGALRSTDGPAYFPYEMRFSFRGRERRVRGLICAVEVQDWGGDIVPHERTMPDPIEDRLRLMRALAANLSCIYAVFTGPNADLGEWLELSTAGDPVATTVDEDRVEHRLWTADPEPAVAQWLGSSSLMIADGHHRYETALRYRDEMRSTRGAGPWDRAMMFVVDATREEPLVLPFHRVQLDGPRPAPDRRVRDLDDVLGSVDDGKVVFGVATREGGALVHGVAELGGEAPVVCRLHEQILDRLGADLRFTPDALAAEDAVRRGEAVAAYLLPPTEASTIRSVVDRGGRLPQKSTFFWPKPRTGLVIRPHDVPG